MDSAVTHLAEEKEAMERLVTRWCTISSSSHNLTGLAAMTKQLKEDFKPLGATPQELRLPARKFINEQGEVMQQPLGYCLRMTKRLEAPLRLLLVGHMDTVLEGEVQKREGKLYGPGSADMKGGLAIALYALLALEKSPFAERIGWELLINPDEEVGSVGSRGLLEIAAKRAHIGLIFEPCMPDGKLVSMRKGSVNYTVTARGVSAHAGRDYWKGKNAIIALADLCLNADLLKSGQKSGTTVNVGKIAGGRAVNQVPDFACCQLNIRMDHSSELAGIDEVLKELTRELSHKHGVMLTLYRDSARPPKPLDTKTAELLQQLKRCGEELGQSIEWEPSGGVCDGNLLSAAGLPTLDTLGAIGGGLHTSHEYLELKSLIQRAQLAALFLMRIKTV